MPDSDSAEIERLKKQEHLLVKRVSSYRKRGYGYAAERWQAELDRCRESLRSLEAK